MGPNLETIPSSVIKNRNKLEHQICLFDCTYSAKIFPHDGLILSRKLAEDEPKLFLKHETEHEQRTFFFHYPYSHFWYFHTKNCSNKYRGKRKKNTSLSAWDQIVKLFVSFF